MASITDYLENAWMDHVCNNTTYTSPTTVYLGLFLAGSDPTDSTVGGPSFAGEVSGNGYARQAVTFAAAASRSIATNSAETFTASGGNWGDVSAIGIFDAATNGNLLAYKVLTADITINDGESLNVASGAVTVAVDAGAVGTYLANALLDHTFRNTAYTSPTTVYSALYTADPGDAGGGTPVSGGGYARQSTSFGASSGGVCTSDADVSWTASGANYGTVTAWALHDHATLDQVLFYDTAFTEGDATVNDGDTFTLASGTLTVSIA